MTYIPHEALHARSCVAADDWRVGRVPGSAAEPAQVVVKVLSGAKSRDDVRRMARYVGRLRDIDRRTGAAETVELTDEIGMPVAAEDLRNVLDDWLLLTDGENLSHQARALGEDAVMLPNRDRFRHRQAVHITWSIPEDDEDGSKTATAMAGATLAIMDEAFARRGFRGLWALHLEHRDELRDEGRVPNI